MMRTADEAQREVRHAAELISRKLDWAVEQVQATADATQAAIQTAKEIEDDVLENSKLSNIEFKSSGCNTYHGDQHCDDKSKRAPPACPEDFGLAFRHGHTWRDGRCGGQLICALA